MAKLGALSPRTKDLAIMTAALTAGGVLAGTVGSEMTSGYQKLRSAVVKGRNFRRMMRENPDLEQLDRKQVQLAFNTINRFNPDFAADPLVAGTWTRQVAGFGEGVPHDRAAQLVQAASNLAKVREAPGLKGSPLSEALTQSRRDTDAMEAAKREFQSLQNTTLGAGRD